MKLYRLARELRLSNLEIVGLARRLGHRVCNFMDDVPRATVHDLRQHQRQVEARPGPASLPSLRSLARSSGVGLPAREGLRQPATPSPPAGAARRVEQESPRQLEVAGAELFVLDGSNLCCFAASAVGTEARGRSASLRILLAIQEELRRRWPAAKQTTLVDASLRHLLSEDDRALLDELIGRHELYQVPAGTDADEYILLYGKRKNGVVVSLDLYRDHEELRKDVDFLKPMVIGSELDVIMPDKVQRLDGATGRWVTRGI